MLVLTRAEGESIMLGDSIRVKVVSVKVEKVRLGIEAPENVAINRQEIYDAIKAEERKTEAKRA